MRPALALACAAALAAADPFAVRLDAGPGGIVVPGAEAKAALVVANRLDHPVSARLAFTVGSFDGASQGVSGTCELPPGGEARVPVPLGDSRQGIRWIAWQVDGDGRHGAGSLSCLYATPAGPGADPAGFLYGVSAHLMGQRDREQQMAAAAAIGIRVVRDDAHWDRLEPEPGSWRWDPLDDLVALGEKHGLEFEMILCYGNPYAAVPAAQEAFAAAQARGDKDAWRIRFRAPQEDGAWGRFAGAIADRYRGRIHMWEVWNEPDLDGFFSGTTDDYIRMLRTAYAAVKRADPQARVLSGGFATVGNHQGRRLNHDLQERVLAEASDAFDIHAYHGHGAFAPFQADVDGELARIRARMPTSRPLYFNETALTAAFNGEKVQAVALVKKLSFARSRGAIGYTWYDLRNDGRDPAEGEHNYGLLTNDLQPKAVYAVYNQLITRLRGTRFAGELALGAGRNGYVFAGGGRRVAVLWTEDAALSDDPVAIRAPGCTGGSVVDLMGNAIPLPAREGVLLVRPLAEPTYLELPGGEAMPEVVGRLITIAGDAVGEPGRPLALTARIANPLSGPLTVTVSWQGDGALQHRELTVAAGGHGELPLAAPCPADATPLSHPVIAFAYAVAGGPWSGTIQVPVQVVQRISARGFDRPADFTIAGKEAVVNFCEADPALAAQTWHGPADQSAQVWLGRGDGALHVRVAVRDDIHHQSEESGGAWRGDGIQVAFQVPGQAGFWEVGAAQADDGTFLRSLWSRPDGAVGTAADLVLACQAMPGGLVYDLAIPYAAFGLSDAILASGLRFNLIVNDNDGPLRKGFIRIAPGIGERKDPGQYPLVRFAEGG